MRKALPDSVHSALRALESRLLAVLFLYGIGRLLATGAALLLALYVLDRLFEPPAAVRLVLAAGALLVLGGVAVRSLLVPLRRRPVDRDFAAIWERTHPELGDLLTSTVELLDVPAGTSSAMVERVSDQAMLAASALEPKTAVPGGRAQRSGLTGLGCVAVLSFLALLAPNEAGVFFQRLIGGDASWPKDTVLVLLPPHVEGLEEQLALEEIESESYRLAVARGTVVTLRLRAEGVAPERVVARGGGLERPMRPLGDGEFVLRLQPLDELLRLSFRGGDDSDGFPRLVLEPGIAPVVVDWSVDVLPPEYTGRAGETSAMNEFRVPQGTRLTARFRSDRPGTVAMLRDLEGGSRQLVPDADGRWRIEALAERSGELLVALQGPDGFRDPRAAMLRWQALPDRAPELDFRFPTATWYTRAEGAVPALLVASDDYGLGEILLSEEADEAPAYLPLDAGALEFRHFSVIDPLGPTGSAEDLPRRFRLEALAYDGAMPTSQESQARSPWIEVLPDAEFEARSAQRMGQARERVERLIERTDEILGNENLEAETARNTARRIRRDLEGLVTLLEGALMERVFAAADTGSATTRAVLEPMLANGAPAAGAVVATIDGSGTARPLEHSGILLDLARLAGQARTGPADALTRALAAGSDPQEPARELRVQLSSMLEVLLTWEDLQGAISLLRDILDRQRQLHIQTQNVADE